MERLQYIIEERTIAELLGVNNFSTDESAILELVKNAYDAKATYVKLIFGDNILTIQDDGIGMDIEDIKSQWMHIGKSKKEYTTILDNDRVRILAGSKGIGRFALARLGEAATLISRKVGFSGVMWKTDWSTSVVSSVEDDLDDYGTKIIIEGLRARWNKRQIENLGDFLSKTYNDDDMTIIVEAFGISKEIIPYFTELVPGVNCLSKITLNYGSTKQSLRVEIDSDEFSDAAKKYCKGIDIKHFTEDVDIFEELKTWDRWDLSDKELQERLLRLGDFSAQFSFTITPSKVDIEKFLYKHDILPRNTLKGVILYRNAFSISSYEGKKDWLGFGKRSRKSPAAASHPTGAWRVRENQISGKVEIDKQRNAVLQDMSNRQGLNEDIYYEIFVEIILLGIRSFERYRQNIIRKINVKNITKEEKPSPISEKILANPSIATTLTKEEAELLASEIEESRKAHYEARRERNDVEARYKYDIRILNVLATSGLKASSIAHEMRNDRNSIASNVDDIIAALKRFKMWEKLNSSEYTAKSYYNIPYLLETNKQVSKKILAFMNTMLSEIERGQFLPNQQNIRDIILRLKHSWETDYAWVDIQMHIDENITFMISEDYLQVVFDNLILNSIQQNEKSSRLKIDIWVELTNRFLQFLYADSGRGLDKKYLNNPEKILEVHETTRKNGHGLGMWIVNNTIVMSGGKILKIDGNNGFKIEFTLGESK